ncbi:MAG: hypothetical protein K2Y32_05410 [Candidatus Obscuribacterales bacterium]|nr:hypothetical protein [Candidatus Obscuribacterales bacterium]
METFQSKLARFLRKLVDRLESSGSDKPEKLEVAEKVEETLADSPSQDYAQKTSTYIVGAHVSSTENCANEQNIESKEDSTKAENHSEKTYDFEPARVSKSFSRFARPNPGEVTALPPSSLPELQEKKGPPVINFAISESKQKSNAENEMDEPGADHSRKNLSSTRESSIRDSVNNESMLVSDFHLESETLTGNHPKLGESQESTATEQSFRQVAENTHTPPTTLNWLAGQIHAEVRAAVASNPSTPQDTLRRLAQDQDAGVRAKVAANRKTGTDILRQLSNDRNKVVAAEARSTLVKKLKTCEMDNTGANLLATHKFRPTNNQVTSTYSALEAIKPPQLSSDQPNQTGTKEAASAAPGAVSGEWHTLESDSAKVAYKQQKDTVKDLKFNPAGVYNRNGPQGIERKIVQASATDTIAFLTMVAARHSTPPSRLLELASHESESVKKAVAENYATPPEAFQILARDAAREVRLRLVENPNCPIEVARQLENDVDPFVAYEARKQLRRTNLGTITGDFDIAGSGDGGSQSGLS